MPAIHLRTNVEKTDGSTAFIKKFSSFAAEIIGKPERWVMASADFGACLVYSGTDDPAAWVEVKSIGLTPDQCPDISAKLCTFLHAALNVPADRIYIEFKALERPLTGYDGGTF